MNPIFRERLIRGLSAAGAAASIAGSLYLGTVLANSAIVQGPERPPARLSVDKSTPDDSWWISPYETE